MGLSVEQQETDSATPSSYRSVIFPSFMITSKKHYVGMKRDGELYTKGMNYIRKSGAVLSSVVTEELVRIALNYNDLRDIRLRLSRVCQEYKWKVKSERYPNILHINMKYMGRRSNYIRTKSLCGGGHQYIQSTDMNTSNPVDVDHYFENIKKSLKLVTTALGIDFDPIYSGHVVGN